MIEIFLKLLEVEEIANAQNRTCKTEYKSENRDFIKMKEVGVQRM